MARLTLSTMRQSRLPECIGACQADIPTIARALNAAEQRLLYAKETGDEGWWASWAEMAFNVLPEDPFIPLNRHIARLERINICKRPVNIENQFYEYLQFGAGKEPKFFCTTSNTQRQGCAEMTGFDRGMFPAFRDLAGPNRLIRVRATDPLDTQGNKRILVQGTNSFDDPFYSIDGLNNVLGVFLTLSDPFADTPFTVNSITGFQKDVTIGAVNVYDVDPSTGAETLILTMEPSEQIAGYRRYYLHGLPRNCCPVVTDASGRRTVQVSAIVKLNHIPVRIDPDYLILQNEEALIAECQSMRYSTMDGLAEKAMAKESHKQAIGLLQGELAHYLGTDTPAISFFPFGSASLERQRIGTMI